MSGKFFSWVVATVSLTLLMTLSLQNSAEATEVEANHAVEPRVASDAEKLKASYAAFLDAVERRDEQIAFEQSMETLRLAEILYQPDKPEPSCSHYERGASSTSFGVRLALPLCSPADAEVGCGVRHCTG